VIQSRVFIGRYNLVAFDFFRLGLIQSRVFIDLTQQVMGPANDIDVASKQSLTVPILRDDGSNWADYEPKMRNALGAKGLIRHVDGLAKAPAPYAVNKDGDPVKPDGRRATEDEIEK
jgi:hypothetical protein